MMRIKEFRQRNTKDKIIHVLSECLFVSILVLFVFFACGINCIVCLILIYQIFIEFRIII